MDIDRRTENKNEFFTPLIALALPMALQNLLSFVVNYADSFMIGQLGDTIISGVYIGNQVHTVLTHLTSGITAAVIVISSQYWGKRDTETIRKIAGQGLIYASIVGGIFSIASVFSPGTIAGLLTDDGPIRAIAGEYLRIIGFSFVLFSVSMTLLAMLKSTEQVRFGLAASSVTLLSKVILSYVLIFGKAGFRALGYRGAAIATLTARIIELVFISVFVLRYEKRVRFRISDLLCGDRRIQRDMIRYGTPVFIAAIVWSINLTLHGAIIGRFDEHVITAYSITGTMSGFVYIWINGLSDAVGLMTGKLIGEKRYTRLKEHARLVQVFFLGVGIVTAIFITVFRTGLLKLYSISDAAFFEGKGMLLALAVTMIGTCYEMPCLAGLVRAAGNTRFMLINDTIFVFLVVTPLSFLCLGLKTAGWILFMAFNADQILKCAVAWYMVNKRSWVRNLTE